MTNDGFDARQRLVDLLLEKVGDDPFPSTTMMDLLEELLAPEDRDAYAAVLMEKVRQDPFPSVPMMRRLLALTGSA